MPRARYMVGGIGTNMIWRSRNADGPLDEQYAWQNPLAPTNTIATKGREVSYATRLIGAEATSLEGIMRFTIQTGGKVTLVTPVLSDLDAPEDRALSGARRGTHAGGSRPSQCRPSRVVDAVLVGVLRGNQRSADRKYYYSSQYVIASASRAGKVAPGLYGNWVTTDHPAWNGDYTLNYNHETPFLALYASNHLEVAGSFEQPVLDIMSRAKQYARTILGVRGVLFPGQSDRGGRNVLSTTTRSWAKST